jgi:hypothetical protein
MSKKGALGFISKNADVLTIAVLYIFWSYPVLSPFLVPIPIGDKAQTIYEETQAIPEGSIIGVTFDYSAVSLPLFQGFQEAFLREVWAKNCKVIFVSFSEQGPMMYNQLKRGFTEEFNKHEYGVDYIHLGFIAGGEPSLASFLQDIRATVSRDFDNNQPLDSFPIMDGINEATDFYLFVDSTTQGTLQEGFIRQISFPYEGVNLFIVTSGGTQLEPYYPDTIEGLLYPMPQGGAEFEALVGIPGPSSAQIALLFVACLFYVLTIGGGNVVGLLSRGKEETK